MADDKGRASGAEIAPRIAIFHPAARPLETMMLALGQRGWGALTLPAPVTGMRSWIDQPYDALVIAPFSGWEEPGHFIALARAIAGTRPLMVLTGADMTERLTALNAGADDAVSWPGDMREIMARLAGLIRRRRMAAGWLECAELRIDLIDRRVTRLDRAIRLPLREFDLLTQLARVPDRIVPRDTLWRAVWKIDFDPGTNRIEVHMSRLRASVDRGFAWPMLMTERGRGYGLRSAAPP
jgi:two-component system, OmpR family, response regulator